MRLPVPEKYLLLSVSVLGRTSDTGYATGYVVVETGGELLADRMNEFS